MKLGIAGAFIVLLLAFAFACGGKSGPKTPAQQTFQAAQDNADQTPVDRPVRQYAKQLCDPLQHLLETTASTFGQIDKTPAEGGSGEGAFATAFSAFGELKGPLQQFQDELKDIDPPEELREAHQGMIDEIAYAIDSLDAIAKGGLFGALMTSTPPPTPEEPPGLEAALIQECGEELKGIADQFGGSFFGGQETPTEPTIEPGTVGEPVRQGNFELTVHSVTDPYEVSEDTYAPQAGDRWVLIDVSLTNVSREAQNYGSFDFTVHDSEDNEYTSGFANQTPELDFGSLETGETIRGQVAYELPAGAALDRLVYNPTFDPADRIEITLR